MRRFTPIQGSIVAGCVWMLAALIGPQTAHAGAWQATVGAQSADLGRQALAFLPNELWIHVGDTITWTHDADDAHTVTFLTAGQLRPLDPTIPPSAGSSFDGMTFVNSGLLLGVGETYTVTFPTAGNFKLVCLVHANMTAAIHVLAPSAALPHDQTFYDDRANHERVALLLDSNWNAEVEPTDSGRTVRVGNGKIVATGGGSQARSVVRFHPGVTVVHAGDTVEWTNSDPGNLHTVTFGPDPVAAPFPIGVNAALDADGALHAIVDLLPPTATVHSGILQALPQDRGVVAILQPQTLTDLVQYPLPETKFDVNQRFRVTFTHPGVFQFHCVFHDNLGMEGQVIVTP